MEKRKRVDVTMRESGYALLSEAANLNGLSMGEELMRAWCEMRGVAPEDMIVPRQKTGRKPAGFRPAKRK